MSMRKDRLRQLGCWRVQRQRAAAGSTTGDDCRAQLVREIGAGCRGSPAVPARTSLIVAQNILGGSTNDVWTFVTAPTSEHAERGGRAASSIRASGARSTAASRSSMRRRASHQRRGRIAALHQHATAVARQFPPDPRRAGSRSTKFIYVLAALCWRFRSARARDGCCATWDANNDPPRASVSAARSARGIDARRAPRPAVAPAPSAAAPSWRSADARRHADGARPARSTRNSGRTIARASSPTRAASSIRPTG